jgi:hypothetical protein
MAVRTSPASQDLQEILLAAARGGNKSSHGGALIGRVVNQSAAGALSWL